jgi:hypothetical protein
VEQVSGNKKKLKLFVRTKFYKNLQLFGDADFFSILARQVKDHSKLLQLS